VSSNPYTAPSAGAEVGGGRGFAFSDELRKLISSTATLMIVAGILQMIPGVAMLFGGLSAATVVGALFFGVIPAFTAVAGFSLRALAKPGDDLGALSAGFRALFIPFLAKGIVMLLVVSVMLLGFLLSIVGVGAGFFAMWN
jgi:hypothetical protein